MKANELQETLRNYELAISKVRDFLVKIGRWNSEYIVPAHWQIEEVDVFCESKIVVYFTSHRETLMVNLTFPSYWLDLEDSDLETEVKLSKK